MKAQIFDMEQKRCERKAETDEAMWLFAKNLPLGFKAAHCAKARAILNWSVEALAFRSGASVKAIKDLELSVRELRRVTMQALAFSFEAEGLLFFPGHDPMTGNNCRGATTNPRERNDFHLIE